MRESVAVTLTSFGEGRGRINLPVGRPTVDEAIRKAGYTAQHRRIAVNGRAAQGDTVLTDGDVVTLAPRVQGG